MRSSRAPFNLSALKLALVKSTGMNAGTQTPRPKRQIPESMDAGTQTPRPKRQIPESSGDDSEDDMPLSRSAAAQEAAAATAAARAAAARAAAARAEAAKAAAAKAVAAKVKAAAKAAAARAAEARAAEAEPAPSRRPQRKGAGEGVLTYEPNHKAGSKDLKPGRGLARVRGRSDDEIEDTSMDWEGNPFFREHLEVKTSTVRYRKGEKKGQLVGQNGLFTKTDIPKGEWVGFYAGIPWTEKEWEELPRAEQDKLSRYAAEAETKQNWVMMTPPFADGTLEPDFTQFPLSSINEPDEMQTANVFTLASQLQLDFPSEDGDYEKEPHEFFVISMFVCRDVRAGEELLWHYGDGYASMRASQGGYTPGKPCPAPPENEHDLYADQALLKATNLAQMIPRIDFVRKLLYDVENSL